MTLSIVSIYTGRGVFEKCSRRRLIVSGLLEYETVFLVFLTHEGHVTNTYTHVY